MANFRVWYSSKEDLLTWRFQYDMNILQLVCHEESVQILNFMVQELQDDLQIKE